MDIVNLLSGGDKEQSHSVPAEELSVNLKEEELVKSLKGSFSEKTKKDITSKTSKAMWKQVNNSLTKIYNIVTNNSKPNNSELYEKVESLSKEVINNKVNITSIKEATVKTPQDILREEDDNQEAAEKVISESVNKVIEESETIASIEDKLINIDTKVGVKTEETKNSVTGIMDFLKDLPGIAGSSFALLESIKPILTGTISLVQKGFSSVVDFIKPIKKLIPESIKSVFSKTGLKSLFKSGTSEITKDLTKKAVKEGAEKVATKGVTKVAAKTGLKSLLKKIPILGALVGAGFAIPRLVKGDYAGAALEVASGVSSTLPGVGTAASLGIDATLFARDLKQKTDVSTVDLDINSDKTKKVIDSVKPVNVTNETVNINNSQSTVRNVSMEDNERDFILASKF